MFHLSISLKCELLFFLEIACLNWLPVNCLFRVTWPLRLDSAIWTNSSFSRRWSEHSDWKSELKPWVHFRTTPTHYEIIITWCYCIRHKIVISPCKVSSPTYEPTLSVFYVLEMSEQGDSSSKSGLFKLVLGLTFFKCFGCRLKTVMVCCMGYLTLFLLNLLKAVDNISNYSK